MYRVIVPFKDLEDNGYVYQKGDTYPREGATPNKKRITELSTASNKRGHPLIEGLPLVSGGVSLGVEDVNPGVVPPTERKTKREAGRSRND